MTTTRNETNVLFWEAVQSGDIEKVRVLLAAGTDPNITYPAYEHSEYYAIEKAAWMGHAEIVTLLAEHHAINKETIVSAYREAIRNDKHSTAECLLKKEFLDCTDENQNTLLHIAVNKIVTAHVHILLELGAKPNLLNKSSQSPLSMAATLSGIDLSKFGGTVGAHYLGSSPGLFTSIRSNKACIKGRTIDIIKDLLAHGANPNFYITKYHSPLSEAFYANNPEAIDLILTKYNKNDVTIEENGQQITQPWYVQPLFMMVREHFNVETLQVLVKHGAKIDCQEPNGPTLFHAVAREYQMRMCMGKYQLSSLEQILDSFEYLIEIGANPVDGDGKSWALLLLKDAVENFYPEHNKKPELEKYYPRYQAICQKIQDAVDKHALATAPGFRP